MLLSVVAACKSAEEKCAEGRSAAAAAWTTYLDGLAAENAAAKNVVIESHRTLRSTVEPRISEAANRLADTRYIPGSEGWSRGRVVVFNELCAKDAECAKLKHDIADSENKVNDIEERLAAAMPARAALEGNASGAVAAANAAIIDPPRPALQLAQAASAQAQEHCADVPAPAPAAE